MMQTVIPPLLTIIIPTYNRPHLLGRAVQSALIQKIEGELEESIEIIVVDDASPQPVELPAEITDRSRFRIVRLAQNQGISATRNVGLKEAKGRYVTYLDDDDQLLPAMANLSLTAIKNSTLPPPVAALSGIEVVSPAGKAISTRLPPVLPKGAHFFLEEIDPNLSFLSKQTLVVERELLLSLGGYDESFRSREHTELFLRLNPACSLVGLAAVTYRLISHEGDRLSRSPALRQIDFDRLIAKHRSIFEAHPKQFAKFVYDHAQTSARLGQQKAALRAFAWAYRIHPLHSLWLTLRALKWRLSKIFISART